VIVFVFVDILLLPPPKPQGTIILPVYNVEIFACDNTTAIAVLAVWDKLSRMLS